MEMPPNDSSTGTITLRGPHDKLGLGGYLCVSAEIKTHLMYFCIFSVKLDV